MLAWGAYLDVTEAARWIDRKLTAALDVFGLTHEEFRLLVVLYKNGPMTRRDATEKLGRIKRAVHETVRTAGRVRMGERRGKLSSRGRDEREPAIEKPAGKAEGGAEGWHGESDAGRREAGREGSAETGNGCEGADGRASQPRTGIAQPDLPKAARK
jgi:hypothetical protein